MRHYIFYSIFLFFGILVLAHACKKPVQEIPNRPPLAIAGPDIHISLAKCTDNNGVAQLDGSSSTDPDFNLFSYRWVKLYGPEGSILVNPTSSKARLERLSAGEYAVILIATDDNRLFSLDTLVIHVTGTPREYDLDVVFDGGVSFENNQIYYSFYYYYGDYFDLVQISGLGNFAPLGELGIYLTEYSDTASQGSVVTSRSLHIRNYANPQIDLLYGECSVNLKNHYLTGGGPFTGIFTVTGGAVEKCDPDVLKNLTPLEINGTLNPFTGKARIWVRGKAFF